MKKIFFMMLCMLSMFAAIAQPGTPDPAFGTNGVVLNSTSTRGNVYTSFSRYCFFEPDGKLSLVMEANGKTLISRRLANGQPDMSWGKNSFSAMVTIDNAHAFRQPDGKIVVGGESRSNFVLARYNTDGSLDNGFGNGGVVITDLGSNGDALNTLALSADGKIYAGGTTLINNSGQSAIVRYKADGSLDPTFGNNGIVESNLGSSTAYTFAIALQTDGKLVALSQVSGSDGGDYALSRYNTDGTPDATFNGTGTLTTNFNGYETPVSMAIATDGSIFTGGYGYDETGFQHFRVAKFTSQGALDPLYHNGDGSVSVSFGDSYDFLTNIVLQPDGKLLAAGFTNLNQATNQDIELIRLNQDGTPDINFGTGGLVTADYNSNTDGNEFLALKSDGSIFTGGYNYDYTTGSNFHFTVFKFTNTGIPDPAFGTAGALADYFRSSYFNYLAIYKQTDGNLLMAGESNDGIAQKVLLSRLNSNGSTDNTYGQNGTVTLPLQFGSSMFQPDGKLLRLSYFNSATLDFLISRYNTDGTADATFGTGGTVITDFGGNEYPTVAAIQADGKIVVAGSQYTDNGSDVFIARYNADGSLDNSFGTGAFVTVNIEKDNYSQVVIIQPDGKILLGAVSYLYAPDFSYIHYDIELIRFNTDGSLDNSFGQGGILLQDFGDNDLMGMIALRNDGRIIYTHSTSLTGATNLDYFAEGLLADGSVDNSFGQSGHLAVDGASLFVQDDQHVLISGLPVNLQNNYAFSLARYNADGSSDNTFGNNGKVINSFTPGDNLINASLVTGNSLFAIGRVSDTIDQGIIVKYRLDGGNGITCPANVVVPTDKNSCSAKVSHIDPTFPAGSTVKYKLTGATNASGNGSASGKTFNKGITTVKYTLNNDATKTCSFTVTVEDKENPVIDRLSATPTMLWPVDHQLKNITLSYSATDNCGVENIQVSITSNEPVQSGQAGDQSPDWQVLDNHHIRLRAERLQNGNGRIYTVKVTVTDLSGNQAFSTVTINVPKSITPPCVLVITATPNPSHNYFFVTLASTCNDKINLRLTDNSGNTIQTMSNINPPQVLKMGNNLIPGIYYLEAIQGSSVKTIKLVKQ